MDLKTPWEPPARYSREDILEHDDELRARPKIQLDETEEVFRITSLGMDWDIAVKRFEPADPNRAARSPDGRKTAFLLLHGGADDYRSMQPLAQALAANYGHSVLTMTFPGRHYLPDPEHDWPEDTIAADGTVRTPIWLDSETITPDQYDVVHDDSMKLRYGTRTLARAKPGSVFYDRMAAWPVAFEDAMIEACRRNFSDPEWWIHTNGHSTGGAFSAYITQRVANIAGQAEIETAPIGYINEKKHGVPAGTVNAAPDPSAARLAKRTDAFNDLAIRTWRDLARYAGFEAQRNEGSKALDRLAWLMEDVLAAWERGKTRPNFKAEFPITHNILGSLEAAARAVAERLELDQAATDQLIARYHGYCHYDESPDARPVPPILYINTKDSRDNTFEAFDGVILPMLAKLKRAPKVRLVMLDAGTHVYYRSHEDLPDGLAPFAAMVFNDAVTNGYYLP